MVMGCTSDAGKSFLVAALCRCLSNRGVLVAPFKAQNMSNNAAVTIDGGEIGRAQWLQARAARVEPSTSMNPVLVKPYADTASQVVLCGRAAPDISALPWMARRDRLWPTVRECLARLIATHDCVVIEGAGSPAEINLRAGDIVNMAVALECQADVYLVADIDRGGAYAHLLGTWECLAPDERRLVRGFVLNKFRGDPSLLHDADEWLRARTGVPVVALVPYLRHRLPEEDAFFHRALPASGAINVALALYPWAANLDEFDPLVHEPGVTVVPVTEPISLDSFRAIILPGTKNTVASLHHLRASGLAAEITRAARAGIPVVGICGGMQMLGHAIHDPLEIESGDLAGLGLLDVTTTLAPDKTVALRQTRWLDGGIVQGYEIHHGRTSPGPRVRPLLAEDLGWREDNVWGSYLHGLFEDTAFRQNFLRTLGWAGACSDWSALVDAELDRVAAALEETGWPQGITACTAHRP